MLLDIYQTRITDSMLSKKRQLRNKQIIKRWTTSYGLEMVNKIWLQTKATYHKQQHLELKIWLSFWHRKRKYSSTWQAVVKVQSHYQRVDHSIKWSGYKSICSETGVWFPAKIAYNCTFKKAENSNCLQPSKVVYVCLSHLWGAHSKNPWPRSTLCLFSSA